MWLKSHWGNTSDRRSDNWALQELKELNLQKWSWTENSTELCSAPRKLETTMRPIVQELEEYNFIKLSCKAAMNKRETSSFTVSKICHAIIFLDWSSFSFIYHQPAMVVIAFSCLLFKLFYDLQIQLIQLLSDGREISERYHRIFA